MRDAIRLRNFYIMLLITEGEGISRTAHEKILVLKGNGYNLPWLMRGSRSWLNWPRTRTKKASNPN